MSSKADLHRFYNKHAHAIGRAGKLGRKAQSYTDRLDAILEPMAKEAAELDNTDLAAFIEKMPADGFYRLELRTLLYQRQREGVSPAAPIVFAPQVYDAELATAKHLVALIGHLKDEIAGLLTPVVRDAAGFEPKELYRLADRLPRYCYCRSELETLASRRGRGLDYEMVL